jgi:RNA polymerase sigma-70 factor (ECF subfamily)
LATAQLTHVVDHLRRLVLLRDATGLSDARLLESYIAERNEVAFEALVRRHASMVLSVCRRTLRNHHDAEDAFQATFLVLARNAASIKPRDRVANWLHGVAYRTALKARALRAKAQAAQSRARAFGRPQVTEDRRAEELHELVDRELSRLADIYRLPILLCDLEGKSIKETTRQLGWPQGTVAGRLARGRKLLARRLARHGLAVAGGILSKEGSALANVPSLLVSSTVRAAGVYAATPKAASAVVSANVALLMEGVLKSMFLTKLKTASVVLVAVLALGVGAGIFSAQVSAEGQKVSEQRLEQKGPGETGAHK